MKTKNKIALIGAAALIIAIIIGGFLGLFGSKNPFTPQITYKDRSTTIIAKGDVNTAYKWMTKEKYNQLLNELNQNKKLLDHLLQILDEKNFVIEDRNKIVERWITNYRELEIKLAQRSTKETIIAEAKDKLTSGDLNGAEKSLKKSFEKNINVVSEKRKVVAALDAFELGVIKELQIDYYGALKFFEKAVQLDQENTDYLNRYGKFLDLLGIYKEAARNYDKAWRIDREIYGSEHPKVVNEYENLIKAVESFVKPQKNNNFYERVVSFIKSIFGHGQPQTLKVEKDWEAVLEEMKGENYWDDVWEGIKSDLEAIKKEKLIAKNQLNTF